MTGLFRRLRSPRTRFRLRNLITRPVIYGSVVQAVALMAYYWWLGAMTKEVFLVGLIGPILTSVLAEHDDEVVAAPTAGVLGVLLFFLAYLAYGVVFAAEFEYVVATWVFAGFVAKTITWSFLLLGGVFMFGMIIGWLIWHLKRYVGRSGRSWTGGE
ncbi:MAG: hypothetical protein ACI91T_001193 [Natronomonas sp.]|jgi:hypothetical protein